MGSGRGLRRAVGALGAATAFLLLTPVAALAAGAPIVSSTYTEKVETSGAVLRAQVNPNEVATTYFFQYTPAASYAEKGFAGASRAPVSGERSLGTKSQNASEPVGGLSPASAYRFRLVAKNAIATTNGPTRLLTTKEVAPKLMLPDSRGWELVSPVDKNGGRVDEPEADFGGGAFQAAAQGGAVTYSSLDSFAAPAGSPGASQYLSRRTSGGWSTQNLTVTQYSSSYDTSPGAGAPYRLFSSDLAGAVLTNGQRCRAASGACPVANPPLPGSGAPAGYRNYYLRNNDVASFAALVGAIDLAHTPLTSSEFELAFAAASPDLSQVVLSSCAALTADAIEVAGSGGECDPAAQNLYLRSGPAPLKLINLLPADAQGTPGAQIAAQGGAISPDGSRVYFTDEPNPGERNLYLREGSQTKQPDAGEGGGGTFQTASADGTVAFFTKATSLYRYTTAADTAQLLAEGVTGVLGASPDGSYLYYLAADGLHLWHQGTTTTIAAAADASNYPPATGTARVSADGQRLVFVSSTDLADFDAKGNAEVYLFTISAGLRCVSCDPSGELPIGPASIPGAYANGTAYRAYKARILSAAGNRLFFETPDPLISADANRHADVYQWEANGTGGCARAEGCLGLISSGDEAVARFVDAAADGNDVFFTSDGSLVPDDPGAVDVYDARVGGGFPAFERPIVCSGDACQSLPAEPEDPTPATILPGPVNPPLHLPKAKAKAKKKKHRHHKKSAGKGKRSKQGGRQR